MHKARRLASRALIATDHQSERRALLEHVRGGFTQLDSGRCVEGAASCIRSATVKAQEAALTDESAPIAKQAGVLPAGELGVGDRSNMIVQNTSVTRGTGRWW